MVALLLFIVVLGCTVFLSVYVIVEKPYIRVNVGDKFMNKYDFKNHFVRELANTLTIVSKNNKHVKYINSSSGIISSTTISNIRMSYNKLHK